MLHINLMRSIELIQCRFLFLPEKTFPKLLAFPTKESPQLRLANLSQSQLTYTK